MALSKYRGSATKILDFSLPVLLAVWLISPVSGNLFALLPSMAAFFLILTVRSRELYLKKMRLNQFRGSFTHYLLRMNALVQNITLALLFASSGFILVSLRYTAHRIGGITIAGVLDLLVLSIILAAYFNRPGIKRTLSRSLPADTDNSSYLEELASKFNMNSPELRIIPSVRGHHANAFSWSAPGGRCFVFANEELFTVLTREEVGGIFTHELGHIRSSHSEKSFLLTSLVPLLWLNLLFIPIVLFPYYIAALSASVAFSVAIAYFYYGRGLVSRRFENQADIFAALNYDKEIYLSSLRKLSLSTGTDSRGTNGDFTSHDSLEDREKLIRGV